MPRQPADTVVIDTNVVLDWLAFADPACAPLAAALHGGRLRWIATPAMRDELAHVLARGGFGRHAPDRGQLLAAWDAHAQTVEPAAAQPGWTCTDPDDQKFIDLAVQAGAAALLTRDRALLALAPRARAIGLAIVPAADWLPT